MNAQDQPIIMRRFQLIRAICAYHVQLYNPMSIILPLDRKRTKHKFLHTWTLGYQKTGLHLFECAYGKINTRTQIYKNIFFLMGKELSTLPTNTQTYTLFLVADTKNLEIGWFCSFIWTVHTHIWEKIKYKQHFIKEAL